jgi:hypothetical protein
MRWPSGRRWLLVPITGGCVAWATVSVLAVFTDLAPVGANTFTTGTWGCSSPGSTTYVATADAWIDEATPTVSNGGTNPLNVQSRNGARNRRALVKFPLPASVPAGCSVTAATLRLYANSSAASRTIDVYRAAAAWTEAVTWNTRPGTTGTAVGSASLGGAGWQQWTVTAQVVAQFPAANNNGFVVRDRTESQSSTAQQQVYRSREATGTPNNRPELIVTFG